MRRFSPNTGGCRLKPDTALAGVIGSQRSQLRVALLRYCAIDTMNMVKLPGRLRELP